VNPRLLVAAVAAGFAAAWTVGAFAIGVAVATSAHRKPLDWEEA
jgi:Kef-type K+ transport system membrane component KefB